MSTEKVVLPAAVKSKPDPRVHQEVIGWFQPHAPVNWTGEILDLRTGEMVKEPSMTKQSFKAECDVNTIVERFLQTGQLEHLNRAAAQGVYEDMPTGLDLQTSYSIIHQAESAFMALPAATRAEFDNDPVKFTEAFHNPSEAFQQKLVDWGLAKDTRPPADPQTPPKSPPEPAKPPPGTPQLPL